MEKQAGQTPDSDAESGVTGWSALLTASNTVILAATILLLEDAQALSPEEAPAEPPPEPEKVAAPLEEPEDPFAPQGDGFDFEDEAEPTQVVAFEHKPRRREPDPGEPDFEQWASEVDESDFLSAIDSQLAEDESS